MHIAELLYFFLSFFKILRLRKLFDLTPLDSSSVPV